MQVESREKCVLNRCKSKAGEKCVLNRCKSKTGIKHDMHKELWIRFESVIFKPFDGDAGAKSKEKSYASHVTGHSLRHGIKNGIKKT